MGGDLKQASPDAQTAPAVTSHRHAVPHSNRGFPWPAFLAACGVFLCGHWLSTLLYHTMERLPWLGEHHGWLALFAGAATVLFSFWLRAVHHRYPHPKPGREITAQFALGVAVLISGMTTALASEHWLHHGPLHLERFPIKFTLLSIGGLLAFSYWLAREQPLVERPVDVEPRTSPTQVEAAIPVPAPETGLAADRLFQQSPGIAEDSGSRALILFVSTPNIVPAVANDPAKEGFHVELRKPDGSSLGRLAGVSAAQDSRTLDEKNVRWNWQQLLRAVEPHHHLDAVWLIGSQDAEGYTPPKRPDGGRLDLVPGHVPKPDSGRGSADYLPACAVFLRRYLGAAGDHVDVQPASKNVNFENFNGLVEVVRGLLHGPLKDVARDRILLDVTRGQKVTSIAGAALTLGNELRFQYVQTGKPFKAVRYDLMPEKVPSPHGHS